MANQFLAGKFAAVTGGTRGIGRAVAERLLIDGAAVALCGRTREAAERTAAELHAATGGEVIGLAADISKLEDVRCFFEVAAQRWAGLDILINNAGSGIFAGVD